ncbi:hypothetical protein NBH00_01670 [Paraconexibacter antarcticus]|uniref:DUF3352 domain-containing protein n=1 Tax=Paraconexibacter antarcticus TaxID=2949664 RepID=A0ABY5DSC6_9ACTN|nr:hypothetical protein [Paraconexibacter antarcticus]UTI64928.1 hypothetical protein NBH00_01670 [Paraconexibacter antarcticus]
MNRPRVLAVLALVVAFSGAGLTAVWLSAGDSPKKAVKTVTIRDPLAEALRQVPRTAPLVAVIDTDTGTGPLRQTLDLLGRLPGADTLAKAADAFVSGHTGLSLTSDLQALAGEPLVIAKNGTSAKAPVTAAMVVPDEATLTSIVEGQVSQGTLTPAGGYRTAALYTRAGADGGGAIAQRDRLLVFASDLGSLRSALKRGARRSGGGPSGLTRPAFTARADSGANPSAAVARIAISGPALKTVLAGRFPRIDGMPWVAAIQGAGVGVTATSDGLRLQARIRTDDSIAAESDLPIVTGPASPVPVGDGDVKIAVRNLAQPIFFALKAIRLTKPDLLKPYDSVTGLLAKFAQVDIEDDILATLTGTSTVTFPGDGHVTLRAETNNADGVRGALMKLRRIGQLAGLAGSLGLGSLGVDTGGGLSVDQPADDTYTIKKDGSPIAVVGLRDDILVASTDPAANVDDIAGAFPEGGEVTGRGAFVATATSAALADRLVPLLGLPDQARVVLAALGTVTVSARAGVRSLSLRVDVPVQG